MRCCCCCTIIHICLLATCLLIHICLHLFQLSATSGHITTTHSAEGCQLTDWIIIWIIWMPPTISDRKPLSNDSFICTAVFSSKVFDHFDMAGWLPTATVLFHSLLLFSTIIIEYIGIIITFPHPP